MFPFSALPAPALPDDHRYLPNFGPLLLDTLPIVIRSIPLDNHARLLNLAEVNKTAYFATREQRRWLALFADARGPRWRSAELGARRRFQLSLHTAGNPLPAMPVAASCEPLSYWIETIFFRQSRQIWEMPSEWGMHMLKKAVEAVDALPAPASSALLWKLLVLHGEIGARYGSLLGSANTLEPMRRQACHCMSEAERQRFVSACMLIEWCAQNPYVLIADEDEQGYIHNGTNAQTAKELKQACDEVLLDLSAWPFKALVMMLGVIADHLELLLPVAREEAALHILNATAAWPVLPRVRILASLMLRLSHPGILRKFADCMVEQIRACGHTLEEDTALSGNDKLLLLENMLRVMSNRNRLYKCCGGSEEAIAILESATSRIGEWIVAQLLALPHSIQSGFTVRSALQSAMHILHGMRNTPAAQKSVAGFLTLREADRRAHGSTFGIPGEALGPTLFQHYSVEDYLASRKALLSLMEDSGEAARSDNVARAWRLFMSVSQNMPRRSGVFPRTHDERIALHNAEALLAEPGIMTDQAWIDLMSMTLFQIRTPRRRHETIQRVLQRADRLPDALRFELCLSIVHLAKSMSGESPEKSEPNDQSSVMDMLLPVVAGFAAREKARLIPALVQLYLHAYPNNSDAKRWLPAITRLFDGLPDPMKMQALEIVMDCQAIQSFEFQAVAALLSELKGQIVTLPAQPQACLLLNLALVLGLVRDDQSEHMLSEMMKRLDRLDVPPPEREAWRILYQAAYRRNNRQAWKQACEAVDKLSMALRKPVHAMLGEIAELPRYRSIAAADASEDASDGASNDASNDAVADNAGRCTLI